MLCSWKCKAARPPRAYCSTAVSRQRKSSGVSSGSAQSVEGLDAILITHEHSDHIGSALTLARKWSIPLYMSWGTARAVGADEADVDLQVLWGDEAVAIGDLRILPYTVPHDAREPLQYVISNGASRPGCVTDVGTSTPHISAVLSGCDALVLECNHDVRMLAGAGIPNR